MPQPTYATLLARRMFAVDLEFMGAGMPIATDGTRALAELQDSAHRGRAGSDDDLAVKTLRATASEDEFVAAWDRLVDACVELGTIDRATGLPPTLRATHGLEGEPCPEGFPLKARPRPPFTKS